MAQVVAAVLFRQLTDQAPADAEAGIPLFWRVETDPDLLLVPHRLAGRAYEQDAVVDDIGPAPAPWGPVVVDLGELRRATP